MGDLTYRHVTANQFSLECLDCLNLSSEHHTLEIAKRLRHPSLFGGRKRRNSKTDIRKAGIYHGVAR